MLRAPLIALLALLAGAASACSDYVPPPGSTLSGFVYHDANANGVRDSCDSPYGESDGVSVELRRVDPSAKVVSSSVTDGEWQLEDVEAGIYFLEVSLPELSLPETLTQPAAEGGIRRYRLSLKGYENLENLNFGVITNEFSLFDPEYNLTGVVFEDSDADGVIDPGECPISHFLGNRGVGYLADDQPDQGVWSGPGPYSYELEGSTYVPVPGIWQVTTPGISSLCKVPNVEPPLPGTRVYVGARKVQGTATVTVRIYNDLNDDGRRGGDEPPIADSAVGLVPQSGSCLFGEALVDDERSTPGEVVFTGLPAGEYVLSGAPPTTGSGAYVVWWGAGRSIILELNAGDSEVFELPFHVPIPSVVVVRLVNDQNRNEKADEDEPAVTSMPVCRYSTKKESYGYPFGGCQETNQMGVLTIAAVYESTLLLGVDPPASKEALWILPPKQEVTVGEGETVAITLLMRRR